jgi:hypothetical protein
MGQTKVQIICIKFKVKETAAETPKMLREAYDDDTLCETITYKWFKCFKKWKSFNGCLYFSIILRVFEISFYFVTTMGSIDTAYICHLVHVSAHGITLHTL